MDVVGLAGWLEVTRRSGGDRRYSVVDGGQEDPLGAGDGCDGHECGGWGG